MPPDVRLVVNGSRYSGWKSVSITRTMEAAAGTFELSVSDRWKGQDESWPIAEEDACQVLIDDEVVIDGTIGQREIEISGDSRRLSYSGRDRAAVLVDCSATPATYRNANLLDLAKKVAAPLGVKVTLQTGLVLPKKPPKKSVVAPGDTAFRVLEEAAQAAAVLLVSDGAGGLVITRAGSARASVPLVLGENVLGGSVKYDADERFARYLVATQVGGDDNASGEATRILAEASDKEIRRTERVHLVRPERGVTTEYARQRAAWEMRTRAARAEAVEMTVHGWQQKPDGDLWPINALVTVKAKAMGIDGELLIVSATHSLDDQGGEVTQLRLMRPDAFLAEPVIKKTASSGLWKELAGGAR